MPGRTTAKPKPAAAIPLDRLVSDKRPAIGKLELPFDYDAAEAFHDADQALKEAENVLRATKRDPEMQAAKREVDKARIARTAALEALTPTVRRFLFRAIPLDDFDKLLLDHKPTDEQVERFGQDTSYNADTFCPALVAASLVWTGTGADEYPKGDAIPREPCYEPEAIYKLWHDVKGRDDPDEDDGAEHESSNFGPAELEALFQTSMSTCRTRRVVDLGKAATR